jgi:hypothetical protein
MRRVRLEHVANTLISRCSPVLKLDKGDEQDMQVASYSGVHLT